MWKAVYAKTYLEKVRTFSLSRQDDLKKAVQRVLLDPEVDGYKRFYLSPYRQEHPSEKQLTLFFVPLPNPPKRVFFVWVNDDQFLHDTRRNHGDDPCVKEFIRLRDQNLLEDHSEKLHEGVFTVTPRPNAPTFIKFEKLGASVHANIVFDGATYYSMRIFSFNDPDELFDLHGEFLTRLRDHFKKNSLLFEIRDVVGDPSFQKLIRDNIDPSGWLETQSNGEVIWTIQ